MSKRKNLLWRILEWSRWYEHKLGPFRAVLDVGLQNFVVNFQISDGDRPPCYTGFLTFGASPVVLCRTIAYAWRMRHVRTMEYTHGDRVVFGNGTEATIVDNFRDGTVMVVYGAGLKREQHRVEVDQIRRATK